MKKWIFLAGAVIGYLLGAHAGRERYDQIASLSRRVANLPPVQRATTRATEEASHLAETAKHAVATRVGDAVNDRKERVVNAFESYVPERFRGGGSDQVQTTKTAAETNGQQPI
jgi:hypothetical protein